MSKEIFKALSMLENERGISVDFMIDKITKAIVVACKSSYKGNDDVIVDMDVKKEVFKVYIRKTVVEEVSNSGKEILLEKAREIDPGIGIDEKVTIELDTKEFGRIAAQTARNIIRQGIKDGEKDQIIKEIQAYNQEFVTAEIDRIDRKSGVIMLKIGKAIAVLPRSEQLVNENLKEGEKIKVYIVEIQETDRGPKIMISRTHPDLVKRLFEKEVPEIYEKIVEIKAVAREAGSRTKIAVFSNDKNVDPVGACIGARGSRVSAIGRDLGGEKLDIVEYSEDPCQFVGAALSPAEILQVKIEDPEVKTCKVVVPDSQLSLAIGNKGQNARLAAKLTGWKIDIKSKSEYETENSDA